MYDRSDNLRNVRHISRLVNVVAELHIRRPHMCVVQNFVFRVVTIFARSEKYRQLLSIPWLLTRGATSFYPWLKNFDTYGVIPSQEMNCPPAYATEISILLTNPCFGIINFNL